MARLRETPSIEETARFAEALRCETLRPELLALTAALAKASPSDSASASRDASAELSATNEPDPVLQAATDTDRRIAALESAQQALAAKVSQLERDRQAGSAEANSAPSPPPAAPAESSETQPASRAAAEAERRIAELETENEALIAEVSRLQQQTSSAEQANSTPPPQPPGPAEPSETQPASQAAADAERRIARLENEKDALAAEVSRLQRDRETPPADEGKSMPAPPPAAPVERSAPELVAAMASLPTGMPARVLIRYLPNNAEARAQAEVLANTLKGQGVEVADLRESRSAIRTELSFSYAPDEAIAQQIGHLIGVAPVRRPQSKDGLMVRPGTVELSLSSDSHLAANKTTSTRESNHE